MNKFYAIVFVFVLISFSPPSMAADVVTCWFPPSWEGQVKHAERISRALSSRSGITVRAKVAGSYPEILKAFASQDQNLVYSGSFVQAIIAARKLGHPLLQTIDGREMYAGILVYKKGGDPLAILAEHPERIAYTIGASSGESSAKAATAGQAAVGRNSHAKAVFAVLANKADGAFVKDWWWEVNSERYPNLTQYSVPGVSIQMNPDNVLTASRAVSESDQARIRMAGVASAEVFGDNTRVQEFSSAQLAFPLGLMKKGRIDPLTYSW